MSCELLALAVGLASGYVLGRSKTKTQPEPRKMATEAPEPKLPEPIPGYDTTPIDTIRQNLRELSLAEREAVRVYEEATLKRRGILNVLKALEQEHANGNV